jgi:hypothetical protein
MKTAAATIHDRTLSDRGHSPITAKSGKSLPSDNSFRPPVSNIHKIKMLQQQKTQMRLQKVSPQNRASENTFSPNKPQLKTLPAPVHNVSPVSKASPTPKQDAASSRFSSKLSHADLHSVNSFDPHGKVMAHTPKTDVHTQDFHRLSNRQLTIMGSPLKNQPTSNSLKEPITTGDSKRELNPD